MHIKNRKVLVEHLPRTRFLSLRVTEEEYDRLFKYANERGMKMAHIIKAGINEYFKEEVVV